MRWLLITTIGRNPGDEWIRIGIQNVIRQVDPDAEYILVDKESPSMRKTQVEFDKCIWCGMPVFWSQGNNHNWNMAWWKELMLGWPSERKNDFMVLGAGSFFPWGRELETVSDRRQLIQSARDVIQRSFCVTARDQIVPRVTERPIPAMICPAVFSILDFRKSHELKLANIMPNGAHYTSFGPQEASVWNEKKHRIAGILRDKGFVFVAHSLAEFQFAQKCGWKKIIPYNGDPYGLLEYYGKCGKYFGNRVHGAIIARGNDAETWSVGYDSRQEAVKLSGARLSRPSELDIAEIEDWASRDIQTMPFDMKSNLDKHVDIIKSCMLAGGLPLSEKSCINNDPQRTDTKTTFNIPAQGLNISSALFNSLCNDIDGKRRVLSIISRLTGDHWLDRNIETFKEAIELKSQWFETLSFLNWYADSFKPVNYLEIGVRRGRSMAQVLAQSPQTRAYGFDLWIENYSGTPNPGPGFVISELKRLQIENMPTLIDGDSHETLPAFWADPKNPISFELILVDGDHSYEGAKKDLEICFEHLAPGGALVFDDISHHSHPELRPLWEEYKARFADYIFIEHSHGHGTGIVFKPPFIKLEQYLRRPATGQQPIHTLKKQRNVLLVRPDSIGDFVIFSGILEHFRQISKDSRIHILVQEHIAELAQNCPYVDEIITFNHKKLIHDRAYANDIIEQLKTRKFDSAIYPVYSRDEVGDFLTLNSGADNTIASTGDESNIPPDKRLANDCAYTRLIPADNESMLETVRNVEFINNLALTNICGKCTPKVWIAKEDKTKIDELLSALNVQNPIVICPISQHTIKDWPLWKWVELISKYKDHPIAICGSAKDRNQAEGLISLSDHNNLHNLCGRITLRQLGALLKRAKVCVSVDTGSVHIAAAVGCPQVVITGGGHFGRFIPYSPDTTLVYLPMKCYQCNWSCVCRQNYCINQIRVETVDSAVRQGIEVQKAVSTGPVLIEEKTNRDCVLDKLPGLRNDLFLDSDIESDVEISEIDKDSKYLVTAIVSTYNAERFIADCLDNLEQQTIANRLEIIVVDSGSKQNEKNIVEQYRKQYDNIKYIRTENRETIYTAWNRAIKIASGKYITNANTDDRHTKDAFEIMVRALEKNPHIAMVYSDQDWIDEVNGELVREGIVPQFSRFRLLSDSYIGSNPMWRKKLHDELGYFDGDSFFSCGDWEFWLRITQKYDLLAINRNLGTRRYSPDCLSRATLLEDRTGIAHHDIQLILKCYHYALESSTQIDHRGISGHPLFSTWPETRLLKKRLAAKLANEKIEPSDSIKEKWDYRNYAAPKLSIVIAVTEQKNTLSSSLFALNEQTEKDFEVIVVGSGFDRDSSDKMSRQLNYNLCWIELEDNFGPSFSRNIGISSANAEYIAFLDEDAVADKEFVANIYEHFSKNNIYALRGKILPRNDNNSFFSPDYYNLGNQIIPATCETGTGSAFRKDVLIEAGGFDLDLFNCEFQELCFRLYMSRGNKIDGILYFPDVIVYQDYLSSGSEWFVKELNNQIGAMTVNNKWVYHPEVKTYLKYMRSMYSAEKEQEITDYDTLLGFALLFEKSNPEQAVLWAEKAVAVYPSISRGCYVLGSLYLKLNRLEEAIAMLEKTLKLLKSVLESGSCEKSPSKLSREQYSNFQECYFSSGTKLAQCYMKQRKYDMVKQVYSHMLNEPLLKIPEKQKAEISSVLAKLDKTLPAPVTVPNTNVPHAPIISDNRYLISAIVSTYNSEKFLQGCLDDLEQQTIADNLEIIVVNCGSQENEEKIVREYQQQYKNIIYIKTEHREGIYTAWNRAVKVARGKFLTNANTDDRHRKDALEIMAETLLANPDVALVYGDQICTDTPNGTFASHYVIEMAKRPEYSRERLLFGCCVGSQPMWRKSLHDELGNFDESLDCAGDWDFWLRISSKYRFKHIPDFLGIYYYNKQGIEHGRKIHSLYERYIVGRRYGNPYISVIPLHKGKDNPMVSVVMPAYNADAHISEAIESVLIQNYRNLELIVVDDGSTDNTKAIVTGFKDERIKYFYKNNSGPSGARNFAISKATGQYIIPLDADDMMTPDSVARHLMEFENHSDVDLVYSDVLLIDKRSNPIRIMKKPEYQDRRCLIRDLFRAGHPIVPFRLGIKRSVFDKIGLYDENLLIGEDYDMMRRFVKAGLKAHHLSEPLHLRRMHHDSLSAGYSPRKVKCHFEAIRRFTDTFTYDELFPDTEWDEMPADKIQLNAKCLAVVTYLAIGQDYINAHSTGAYANVAFQHACSELRECLNIDPGNHQIRELLQKCEHGRQRYEKRSRQLV
jgi:glycosyltransferase involved in cell wall biosynthesis/ADP-heptose:LPS heptosyltransferase/predicted O-methyltransferase YrrM